MGIPAKKQKAIDIPAPTGEKLPGVIKEVKLSERFGECVDLLINLPDYVKRSDDGTREFVKRVYYSIGTNWSAKNKGGRLYKSLHGRLPGDTEVFDWEEVLKDQEVLVILEDVFDDETGDKKGQKIKWIGAKNPPPVQVDPELGRLGPDENLPPEIDVDKQGDEEIPF